MKKFLLLIFALLSLSFLCAVSNYLIGLPVSELSLSKEEKTLREAVQDLSESDLEIYYYNDFYVIAGSNRDNYPGAIKLGTLTSGKFYLITIGDRYPKFDFSTAGEVLLEMGSVVLIKTDQDEIQLRQRIQNPFVPLLLEPMHFPEPISFPSAITSLRTDIEDMISDISADSVLYFIQALQNFSTRYALADNHLAVANWIKSQFQRFGISNANLNSFNWNETTQYDVVATIPGTLYPDTYIIVGGHHDSITYDNPFVFAPGADDNASGTVAALEMARVMMANNYQPKCSIRFVTFAAEEFGLWGSWYYATMADQTNMNIRLMLNHDMIANTSPNPNDPRVLLMPYDGFIAQTDYAAMLTFQYTSLQPVYGYLNSASSDSHSFWQHGFPVVYFQEYNFSPVYHSNNDTVTNLDPIYCAEVIRASTAVTVSFATMLSPPVNLTAQDEGTGNSVHLSWSPVLDPDFSHYHISWGITQNNYTNSQTTTNNQISISGLNTGQLYYFAVSSVDFSGIESYSITTQCIPMLIPQTPVNFTDYPLPDVVQLIWAANTELDLAGYKLYRSLNSSETGALIATLPPSASSYIDPNVQGGEFYYYYFLCAFDNDNNSSSFTPALKTRPLSMNCGLLIIDETADLSGSSPFQLTDEAVDNFYDQLLEGLWNPAHFDLADFTEDLRLCDIGIYSVIIWHSNDFSDMTYPYQVQAALKNYIYYGGKVLFSVFHPGLAFELNADYPAVFSEDTFINEVLGISGIDYTIQARFNKAESVYPGYLDIQVDPDKVPVSFNGHLYQIEALSTNAQAVPVYHYASAYENNSPQGVLNGGAVGVQNTYFSGKTVTFSFPLYYMDFNQSRQVVHYIIENYFGLPDTVADEVNNPVPEISLLPNQPNPFSASTQINILCKNNNAPLEVKIYNLKGQLVKTLFQAIPNEKNTLYWEGNDNAGKKVSSGIYFIKAQQGKNIQTRKILLLK
ncbi:MAG: M20/M25/M40 family metallo-hydrolase [Candidatus Cloacimonas sp.]|nr:M20/M25/M40 family metallo-hydrolase [Candidatus Cloacimonas sp.]